MKYSLWILDRNIYTSLNGPSSMRNSSMLSFSTRVTRSHRSAKTCAVKRPAMPPPITTASVPVFLFRN